MGGATPKTCCLWRCTARWVSPTEDRSREPVSKRQRVQHRIVGNVLARTLRGGFCLHPFDPLQIGDLGADADKMGLGPLLHLGTGLALPRTPAEGYS